MCMPPKPAVPSSPVVPLASAPAWVIFENVRIFNGSGAPLSGPSNVLVVGNLIKTITTAPITIEPGVAVTRIDGHGRTLMPGLIDAHSHISMMAVSMNEALNADIGYVHIAAGQAAEAMLLRGFTTCGTWEAPALVSRVPSIGASSWGHGSSRQGRLSPRPEGTATFGPPPRSPEPRAIRWAMRSASVCRPSPMARTRCAAGCARI